MENSMLVALVAEFELQLAIAVDKATAPLVNVIAGLELRIEELETVHDKSVLSRYDVEQIIADERLVSQRDMESAIESAMEDVKTECVELADFEMFKDEAITSETLGDALRDIKLSASIHFD